MYEDLEEYQGEKTRYDNCDREFTEGEIITVDREKGMVFCYTGYEGGCLIAYVFSTGEVYAGNIQAMRFRGSKWRVPENPLPNYPNMPIKDKKAEREKRAENESWLRKVLGGLGL